MGFLQSIVVGSCAFLVGLVFVCQTVDVPLLYSTPTAADLQNAYTFYEIWYAAPSAVKAVLHVASAIPLFALVVKLHRWSESAMFFDGSSLVLHMASLILYITVHVPSLRTFLPESLVYSSVGSSSPLFNLMPPPSPREKMVTEAERIESVKVLAAANTLVGLCQIGILLMQAGQEYARRQEEREQREIDAKSRATAAVAASTAAGGAVPAESKKDK